MKIEYEPKPRRKARLKQLNKANRLFRRYQAGLKKPIK